MQVNKVDNNTHFGARIKIAKDIKNKISETSTTSTLLGSFTTVSSGIASDAISESTLIHSDLLVNKIRKTTDNIKELLKSLAF